MPRSDEQEQGGTAAAAKTNGVNGKHKRARKGTRRRAGRKRAVGPKAGARKTAGRKRGRRKAAAVAPRAARRGRSRGRTRYTDAKRQEILSTAQREGLTANQVQERFGVTPVTYYSWRKQSGTARPGGRRRGPGWPRGTASTSRSVGNFADMIRQEVRRQIEAMLPEIVESEIGSVFGGRSKRR